MSADEWVGALCPSMGEGGESDPSSLEARASDGAHRASSRIVRVRLRKSYSRSPAAATPTGAHRRPAEATCPRVLTGIIARSASRAGPLRPS